LQPVEDLSHAAMIAPPLLVARPGVAAASRKKYAGEPLFKFRIAT
jgi:hypothetical protein